MIRLRQSGKRAVLGVIVFAAAAGAVRAQASDGPPRDTRSVDGRPADALVGGSEPGPQGRVALGAEQAYYVTAPAPASLADASPSAGDPPGPLEPARLSDDAGSWHAAAAPLRLSPRSESAGAARGDDDSLTRALTARLDPKSPLVTVGSSLAIVLGLFSLATWFFRKRTALGGGVLPREVFELLGRAPLPGKQQLCLVRCGHKLLLLALSLDGAQTVTEITEPEEVERLAGLCHRTRADSATANFHQLLDQFAHEPEPQAAALAGIRAAALVRDEATFGTAHG